MQPSSRPRRSSEEVEDAIGDQVRAVRIAAGHDQAGLAALAGVSLSALKNLEQGKGSTLRTLVPERTALFQNGDALREWLGVLAYALSYDSFRNAAFPRSTSAISESTISGLVISETVAVPAADAPDQSPAPSR